MTDIDLDDVALRAHTLIAHLQGAIGDFENGDNATKARRLSQVRNMQRWLSDIRSHLEESLTDSLTDDGVVVDGHRWKRKPAVRSTFRENGAAMMRADMTNKVAYQMALNTTTGEVDRHTLTLARQVATDLLLGVPSFSSMKEDFRERYGLRMSDYREYTDGYEIDVEEVR